MLAGGSQEDTRYARCRPYVMGVMPPTPVEFIKNFDAMGILPLIGNPNETTGLDLAHWYKNLTFA